MTNYVKLVDFASKDALSSGNPAKSVKGTEINTELTNVATAIATKEDTANKNAANGYVGLGASNESAISGSSTASSFIPSGSSPPTNGLYLPAANTVGIASNTTLRASVNSTGAWSFAAPSSGIAMRVNGVAGSPVAVIDGPTTSSYVRFERSGTSNGYIGSADSVVSGGASGNFGVVSAGGLVLGYNTSATSTTISSTGNVTISAPSSGTCLTVGGVAGALAHSTTAAGQTYSNWVNSSNSITAEYGVSATECFFGTATSHPVQLNTNNISRITVSSAGNATINAPSSGTTLALTGVANGNQLSTTDGTITTVLATAAGKATWGVTSNHALTLYSNSVERMVIASAGNVTINAPSSGGVPLTVNTAAGASNNTLLFSGSTTGAMYERAINTGGDVIYGVDSSVGGVLFSGTAAYSGAIGTTNATSFHIATNNSVKVTVSSAGAVTFAGGLSGITTLAMTGALSGATTGAFSSTVSMTGLTCTTITASGAITGVTSLSMGGALTGATTGSFSGAVGTGDLSVTGTISRNGTLIDENGSFTGSLTGCTTTPTGTVSWSRSGNVVVLSWPDITGTSNAFTMTLTGMPASIYPSATRSGILTRVQDTGTLTLGIASISTAGVITFGLNVAGNSFNNTGTKGAMANTITYNI